MKKKQSKIRRVKLDKDGRECTINVGTRKNPVNVIIQVKDIRIGDARIAGGIRLTPEFPTQHLKILAINADDLFLEVISEPN